MKIIQPSVALERITPQAERLIELAGRTCYKSLAGDDTTAAWISMIMRKGHESVLEHASATFRIVTDRGITHELVRHRIASFSQESTRYVNYAKGQHGGHIAVVRPSRIITDSRADGHWRYACEKAERAYFALLEEGCAPQEARAVLPTCTKAEIVMTANFREWRHFLKLRLGPADHPDMRVIARLILAELVCEAPNVFGDLQELQ